MVATLNSILYFDSKSHFFKRILRMPDLKTISITKDSSNELISEVEKVISNAFASLLVVDFFTRSHGKIPFSVPIDNNKLNQSFINKLKSTMERGHVFEAILSDDGSGNIATAASWAPPGKDNEKFDSEYGKLSRPLKNKYLAGRDFWVLNLLGRNPGDETKG